MERVETGAETERVAELTRASGSETVAILQSDVLVLEPPKDVVRSCPVLRIALEILAVLLRGPLIRRPVHVVDRAAYRGQAASDHRLAQGMRRDRQVRHRAEAAKALAQDAPALDSQLLSNQLGVAHDRIGAEIGEIVGLLLGCRLRQVRVDRSRSASPALIHHQQPEILQNALVPASRRTARPPRLHTRATLEK